MNGLLVDDDEVYAHVLQRSLARRKISARIASTIEEALQAAREEIPEFALVDLKLGAESGLNLIAPLRALSKDMIIVVVTGYASVATAVETIKRGADNYLAKPVTAETLLRALREVGADDTLEPAETMTPLSRLEWEHIAQAMQDCNGNISAAARLLGMHRRSLQRKLAKRPGPERLLPRDP